MSRPGSPELDLVKPISNCFWEISQTLMSTRRASFSNTPPRNGLVRNMAPSPVLSASNSTTSTEFSSVSTQFSISPELSKLSMGNTLGNFGAVSPIGKMSSTVPLNGMGVSVKISASRRSTLSECFPKCKSILPTDMQVVCAGSPLPASRPKSRSSTVVLASPPIKIIDNLKMISNQVAAEILPYSAKESCSPRTESPVSGFKKFNVKSASSPVKFCKKPSTEICSPTLSSSKHPINSLIEHDPTKLEEIVLESPLKPKTSTFNKINSAIVKPKSYFGISPSPLRSQKDLTNIFSKASNTQFPKCNEESRAIDPCLPDIIDMNERQLKLLEQNV